MKQLSILIPKGAVIVDTILGAYNLFSMANAFYVKSLGNKEPLFKVDLVGQSLDKVVYQNGMIEIQPTAEIDSISKTDLIIVSSITGNLDVAIEKNRPFIDWIKTQRLKSSCDIASLCRGAVLLAETGLLNGKSCSTHWMIHNQFKNRYPEVKLIDESIISEDSGVYSSGGAYSFLNFLIYLIERYYGRETALWCSKVSEIEFDRVNQGHFTIFNGQKDHSDEEVKLAQLYIEENYAQKLSIDELADRFNVSSRNFLRRFKKATYNTPLEYLQRVRIEAAKRLLETTVMNVQQVMLELGYNDDKSFRVLFKKYTGITPAEYRNKYNREIVMAS